MKQTALTTREDIVKLLKSKKFSVSENSNKNVNILYTDHGRVIFRITPSCHIEVVSDGKTVAQFKQPLFNVTVMRSQILIMTGSDESKDYMNVYIPRKEVK